jgi:hypothetical protein
MNAQLNTKLRYLSAMGRLLIAAMFPHQRRRQGCGCRDDPGVHRISWTAGAAAGLPHRGAYLIAVPVEVGGGILLVLGLRNLRFALWNLVSARLNGL